MCTRLIGRSEFEPAKSIVLASPIFREGNEGGGQTSNFKMRKTLQAIAFCNATLSTKIIPWNCAGPRAPKVTIVEARLTNIVALEQHEQIANENIDSIDSQIV